MEDSEAHNKGEQVQSTTKQSAGQLLERLLLLTLLGCPDNGATDIVQLLGTWLELCPTSIETARKEKKRKKKKKKICPASERSGIKSIFL